MIVLPSAAVYLCTAVTNTSHTDMKNLMPTHQRKFFDIAGAVCIWRSERAHTRF